MEIFLVRYRVGNKTFEEEVFASDKKEASETIKTQAGWDFPNNKVKIISLKTLNGKARRT